MTNVQGLAAPARATRDKACCVSGPGLASTPSTDGACETRIWPAMPMRKPVITGMDKRSAMKPNLSAPPQMRMSPTMRLSAAAAAAYWAGPAAASTASAPAKMGAIVESAPTESRRLAPKRAKPIAPARRAKKPIRGGSPARRAVAICSGMAMAASVRPATASAPKSLARQPAKDRNMTQGRWALAGAAEVSLPGCVTLSAPSTAEPLPIV